MTGLNHALGYARRGLRVHPCIANRKEPLLPAWHNQATVDPATIRAWWRRWPEANVGIACGGPFRLLVIDVDPDKDGEASLTRLEATHGPLPAAPEVVTPRGGRHLYLLVPDGRPMPGNSASKLGPGIDTRGGGGYVLAPPSVVSGRPYIWSVDSGSCIARTPPWLLDLLDAPRANGKAAAPEEWQEIALQGVDAGARNQTIARLAGLLLRRLQNPILAAELVVCFNQMKVRPPLDPAELKRTLDSIAAKEMRRQRLTP